MTHLALIGLSGVRNIGDTPYTEHKSEQRLIDADTTALAMDKVLAYYQTPAVRASFEPWVDLKVVDVVIAETIR